MELCQNEGNGKNHKLKQAKYKFRIWYVRDISEEKLAKGVRIYNISFLNVSETGRVQKKL